jgi:hypothetical protein
MQSRALRSESTVSVNPTPNGLTTPAATTATRALTFFSFGLLDWAMVGRKKLPRDFLLLSYSKHFTSEPKRKRSPEVGGLSVEFIQ